MDESVSIIIITWNNLNYTKLCIESIEKYTDYPHNFIFVDNGSSDGTERYLKKIHNSVLILNPKNLGYSRAVNQGISKLKSKYFCLLNNDIIVSKNWLTDLIRIFGANPKFEQLTTNSNTIIDKSTPLDGVCFDSWMEFKKKHSRWVPQKLFTEYYKGYEKFVAKNNRKFKGVTETNDSPPWFLGGWCILMRSSILNKIGGYLYDERFKFAFWEDVDLSWRIGLAGGKLAVAREIYLHHFINITAEKFSIKASELSSRNKDLFMEKWEDFILNFLKEKSEKDKEKLKEITRKDIVLTRFINYYGVKSVMEHW